MAGGENSPDNHSHQRELLQRIFESLPALFLILTPELVIAQASDAYLKATMTRREDIMGRGLFEVFPDNPDDPSANGVPNLRASLDRVRANLVPDRMAIQKYDVREPDGTFEERFWSPVNSPVLSADGVLQFIIHRVEDVTEFVLQKRQAEGDSAELKARLVAMEAEIYRNNQALSEANRLLAEANTELEAFSYSVSHDLRAPLRAVDGFAQAVVEDYGPLLPPDGMRQLGVIRESAKQMGRLIDDLLDFSRLGRRPLAKQQVEMASLARSVLDDLLAAEPPSRRVTFTVADLPACQGDASLLRQLWINLLSNALKYSRLRPEAVIEIGFRAGTEGTAYFVRDNGVGFDPRYAGKLFGVFQRLHRAEDYEGTGVGLALVQRIVHRHGGRVRAESVLGQGATFHFTLEKPSA